MPGEQVEILPRIPGLAVELNAGQLVSPPGRAGQLAEHGMVWLVKVARQLEREPAARR